MSTPAVLARLLNQACTLVTRTAGPPDAYGDPTWTEQLVEAKCHADQASAGEPGDEHYQATDWRFVLDVDAPVDGLDAIVLNGRRFEVIGPPWRAHNPRTGMAHHVELTARATDP